jgi:hypothetical protein
MISDSVQRENTTQQQMYWIIIGNTHEKPAFFKIRTKKSNLKNFFHFEFVSPSKKQGVKYDIMT